jgi:hypothetical protein
MTAAHDTARLRMVATLALSGLVLSSSAALAQEVFIAPRLRAGDEFRLEITRSREESSEAVQKARSTTTVDVRVASVSADGAMLLEWVPGPTSFGDGQTPPDLVARAAAVALEGLTLRLSINAAGEFNGVANEREVTPKLQVLTDFIVAGAAEDIPEHDRQAFRALIAQIVSPDMMLRAATTDVKTYLGLNGITIAEDQTIEADLEQPNPLGEGSIPSRFRISAKSVTGDTAVFVTSASYDSKAFLQVTRSLMERTGKTFTAEELAAASSIEMLDEGRFVLDRTTGLMREVIARRRMRAGDRHRLDEWDIRLVRPPHR